MRIVFGLHDFSSFAGTETYTVTVAEALVSMGHEVVVHPGTAGEVAEVARERGVAVVTDPDALPRACDAVIAQDAGSAYALAARYPAARRLMVAHSDYYALQSPPQLEGVCDAVVVLNDRVRRHVEHLAASPPVIRLRQPVDLKRFGLRGGAPERAHRALILGNYLRGHAVSMVVDACREAGLEPVLSGVHTTPTRTPEQAIADVEVVIGLGRCVVEAMASRRAAYVHGIVGGDGWVTPERYAMLEADGFGGLANDLVVDRERLAADLAGWDPEMGPRNRQLANAHHGAPEHAAALLDCLREIRPGDRPPLDHAAELARLVHLEWQSWSRYSGALDENRDLRAALEREREAVAGLREELAGAAAATALERDRAERLGEELAASTELAQLRLEHLEAFQATRRYRLAGMLASPMDALRGRPRR